MVSYALAAGLYAAAAIFVTAALMVGATAGFRWIEVRYGLFEAFGASVAFLVAFLALFVLLAFYTSKRAPKRVVSLASRLRVAISAAPSAEDIGPAAAVASLPNHRDGTRSSSVIFVLIAASSLIGWALSDGEHDC